VTDLTGIWRTLPLGSLLREPLRNGHSAKASGSKHGLPTLTLTAVTNGDFSDSNIKQTVAEPNKVRQLWIQPGDIFIQRSNTPALVGTARLYRGAPNLAIFPDLLIRVRLNDDADPRYVEAFLQSPIARAYFTKRAQGIAGSMPKIDQAAIEALPIPLATKPEQLRVVEEIEKQLTRIEAGVAALKRVQANLKRYRASVLKAACEGHLVPPEAELARRESRDYEPASVLLQRILKERRRHWEASELAKLKAKGKPPTDDRWKARYRTPEEPNTAGLPELPAGWCWSAVEQLCESVTDGDHQPPPQVENGIPFLVIGNIRDGTVNLEDCRFVSEEYFRALDPARSPRRGDVLYSVTGSFGLTVLVEDDTHFCVQRHIAILRPSPGVAARYLVRALSSNAVFRAASAIATGTAQKTVPLTGLRRLAVPLPPGTEQQRIADEIDRRFTLLGALEKSVSANQRRANGLRQSLLGAAFEGKLVPPASLPFASVASATPDVAKRGKRPTAAELSDV